MSEWISVDDELPETWQEVLICTRNEDQPEWEHSLPIIAERIRNPVFKKLTANKMIHHDGGDYLKDWVDVYRGGMAAIYADEVTHWMPLPKPPKVTDKS